MYHNVPAELYLKRKHQIFLKVLKNYNLDRYLNWIESAPVTGEVAGSSPVRSAGN